MSIEDDCLVRDDKRCFKCGAIGPRNCHHRLFASSGGPDSLDNRIMLCGSGNVTGCHGWVHKHKAAAMAEGWAISRYNTDPPSEIPVRHWNLGLVWLTEDGGIVTEAERKAREEPGHGAADG